MDEADVRRAVREFIRSELIFDDRSEFADDDPLLQRGLIDSTGVLELIAFLESTYSIEFDDDDLVAENFGSISRIASFVARLVS